MNPESYLRKIVYLVAIVILLVPLFWLGHPATSTSGKASGGILAQLRADPRYGLSQKNLGQIDATSETVKLATLGLRGVAANLLWGKAHLYKKKKDWTNLQATVKEITLLQPNFISVWIFQGWNLSYNVSAEFDGFRDRYYYVVKGVEFLEDGIGYNEREPRLPWELGWIVSQKIGRADESKQFRRLFRADDAFQDSLPYDIQDPTHDNWRVGKNWFRRATDLVDSTGVPMKGRGPLIYRSSGPMCQMNYADALENDGRFGSVAQQAWREAAQEWEQYGSIDIPTAHQTPDGRTIFIELNDLDRGKDYQGQIKKINQELNALEPGLREKIKQEKEAELTDKQRQALKIPPLKRTAKQQALAGKAEEHLEVTPEDVARRISDPKKRARAVQLWRDLRETEAMAAVVRQYRGIVNFDYWRLRANVEQSDEALKAHELIHLGEQEREEGHLDPAKQNYDQGLAAWRAVLDKFPQALTDETFGEDLMEVIQNYRKLLDLRDEKEQRKATYGKNFILHDIVQRHEQEAAASPP
jgi:tetratricopeptide (TPR) repeat protein